MGFSLNNYNLLVEDQRSAGSPSQSGAIISGVLVFVYDAGTKDLSTIYSDNNMTAKTNPISRSQFASDDAVKFWSAASSHDIFIADDKGNVQDFASVTPNDHVLELEKSSADKCFVIPFTGSSTETDSGIDLPDKFLIRDVFVEVVTADTTETIDIGLLSTESSGDADGLLASVPMGTTGVKRPFTITDGTTDEFVSASLYGALMGVGQVGTTAAGDAGLAGNHGHIIDDTAVSVSHQASAGTDTGAGYIYIFGKKLR